MLTKRPLQTFHRPFRSNKTGLQEPETYIAKCGHFGYDPNMLTSIILQLLKVDTPHLLQNGHFSVEVFDYVPKELN